MYTKEIGRVAKLFVNNQDTKTCKLLILQPPPKAVRSF